MRLNDLKIDVEMLCSYFAMQSSNDTYQIFSALLTASSFLHVTSLFMRHAFGEQGVFILCRGISAPGDHHSLKHLSIKKKPTHHHGCRIPPPPMFLQLQRRSRAILSRAAANFSNCIIQPQLFSELLKFGHFPTH
jgi:hypothetical protein